MVHFQIVTLFPESIEPYLTSSIIGRAIKDKKIKVSFYDPKEFTRDKYGRVDRRPIWRRAQAWCSNRTACFAPAQKAIGNKKGIEKIFFLDRWRPIR